VVTSRANFSFRGHTSYEVWRDARIAIRLSSKTVACRREGQPPGL
jgi:hypothetical protein